MSRKHCSQEFKSEAFKQVVEQVSPDDKTANQGQLNNSG